MLLIDYSIGLSAKSGQSRECSRQLLTSRRMIEQRTFASFFALESSYQVVDVD
jgi:hypothetical protein